MLAFSFPIQTVILIQKYLWDKNLLTFGNFNMDFTLKQDIKKIHIIIKKHLSIYLEDQIVGNG